MAQQEARYRLRSVVDCSVSQRKMLSMNEEEFKKEFSFPNYASRGVTLAGKPYY